MANCSLTLAEAVSFAQQRASVNPWTLECSNRLVNLGAMLGDLHGGLVGQDGVPVSCLDNGTWGVNKTVCDKYCSFGEMPGSTRFNVLDFVQGINSFLLPWIALTAQLPYEAGGLRHNLTSGALAIGSPALITFSLGITISNRLWAKKKFDRLTQNAKGLPNTSRQAWIARTEYMKFLLEEAQQEPLRVDDKDEFIRFVTLETPAGQNDAWKTLYERLQITQRRVTASLFAQTVVAILAWILTIVASFLGELGNINAALQTAAGILWMWLIPVVSGWVAVGTQTRALAVSEAFEDAFEAYREHDSRGARRPPIRADTLSPRGTQNELNGNAANRSSSRPGGVPLLQSRWWSYGPDAHGDGVRRGPLYNYARAATWWQFARTMEKYADRRIQSLGAGREQAFQSPMTSPTATGFPRASGSNERDQRVGSVAPTRATTSGVQMLQQRHRSEAAPHDVSSSMLNRSPLASGQDRRSEATGNGISTPEEVEDGAYPKLADFLSEDGWWRFAWPVGMAVIVQFGTTIPAVVIARQTPPVGIGCSSGSYLIYGVASSLACILLVGSAVVSHRIRYDEQTREAQGYHGRAVRTPQIRRLSWVALLMLGTGKLLAILNCVWLIASTLFELCGLYSTCFCYSSYVGLGNSAWVVLWKDDADLRGFARGYWILGISLAGSIWVFSIGVFVYLALAGRLWRWWNS